jgi:hypothetical protein
MSLTYSQLVAAIEDYLQYNDPVFVANLPVIIQQAEDRIYQSVQDPVERKNSTGNLTQSNQYLGTPSDMLSVASFSVVNPTTGAYTFLLPREVSFIREAYPNPSTTSEPKFYAFFDQNTFIIAPTPNANYAVELNYHAKPASIVQYSGNTIVGTTTTFISQNCESVLLSACILESYIFLKGDADLIALYDARYKDALAAFQFLGEGLDEQDSFRNGTKRMKVNP